RDGCVKETRALSQPSSSVIHLHDTAPKRRTFPKCPALVRQMEGVEREAGRLLVIPAFGSHWSGMKPLVEELGRRGHEVVVVFPEENPKLKPAKHATTIRYPVTYTNDEMEKNMEVGLDKMLNVDVSTNLAKFVSFYITLDLLNVVITRNAESLMTNDDLMKKLQSYNFDAILTDPFETVGIIASEYLSIPTIYMQTSHPCGVDALVTQCPAPPSYVPQGLTHFTNNMDLWQRSINFLRSLYQPQACRRMFNRADEIASHVLQKKITAKEILSRAALWFMHFDFAFELPRPLMPNMVLIGGVDTKKAEPLSQKLDYKTSLKQRVDSEPQNSLAHKPSTHLCIDRMAASLLLSCFFCLGLAEAGKLLVLPSDGSHWTGMRPLVEELGKKGHEVVVVIPEASLSMGPSQHTTTLTYPVPYTKTQLLEQVNAGVSTLISAPVSTDLARFQSYMNTMDLLSVLTTRNVNGFFSEKDLMKKLRDYDFDAILTDPFEPIGVIASEFLSLPAIYVQSGHPCSADALAAQRPAPPSYVPHGFTFFTDRMNLWQRSVNFIRTLLQPMACGRMFVHADEIATRVLQRKTSMLEILTRAALWFLLLSLFLIGSSEAGKLLVVPSDGSHWLGMRPVVEELGRRGNQVVVVIPDASLSMGPSKNTTTLTFPVNYTKAELHTLLEGNLTDILTIDLSSDFSKFFVFFYQLKVLQNFIVRNAEGLLFNEDLMKKLKDYQFDAILTDPFEPVGVIVGEYLSIPAIYMQINLPCAVDTLASQCPSPPSYVPQRNTHFTEKMNLWQRSINLIRTILQPFGCRYLHTEADAIASRLLQKKTSVMEIMHKASLWFMRFDFAFEFPRPLMPNMVMIGGMATKNPKPLSQVTQAGKVLVMPVDGSHWLSMKILVEELSGRGHEVVVLVPETNVHIGKSGNFTAIPFPVPYTSDELEAVLDEIRKKALEKPPSFTDFVSNLQNLIQFTNMQCKTCETLVFNEALINSLREMRFDVMLTDPFLPCGTLISESFLIPAVYFLRGIPCRLDEAAAQCPAPPSFVPRFFTGHTDKMTFTQRLSNNFVTVFEKLLCRQLFGPFDELASRFLQKETTYGELLGRGAVWLLRYDFAFEYPKPQMPNMVQIGGINCAKRRPLTKELEEFVNGSGDDGFVVFTLGSMVSQLPEAKAREFFEAFRQIPQRVLWRYTGKVPEDAPKNVKLMKWLPQNDLLGHAKVKAFITHGGSHGIYEGICNGVPMVMLPLFGDQGDNVQRLVSRGVAESLSIYDVTSEKLLVALRKVINDKSYKEKMTKLSSIHRDRPIEPLDLAVFWTEFVMRHKGAAHLRPAAHELNWIQYHSLDVIGFLLLILVTVVFVSVKSCMFCFRKCVKRIQKKKKE
ncbi:hypothetical protein DNTS_024115, partial [Danionella cerebrum]